MTRSKPITFGFAAAVPLAALAVAGCGGGGGGSGNATAAAPPAHTSNVTNARSVTVHSAQSRLGKILVDSRGRTLYLFKKDSGTKSACFGSCATFWPPLRTHGKPVAGSGVKASLLKTIKRSDGAAQVTYNGHPLYTFAMDKKAGTTKGEGVTAFGGTWFVVSPSGKAITRQPAKASPQPAAPKPAPKATAPKPAPKPAPQPAAPKPAPKPPPPAHNGIPQNGGGDGDADNNGGPDDGDGGV